MNAAHSTPGTVRSPDQPDESAPVVARLWPALGLRVQAAAIAVLTLAVLFAYAESFSAGWTTESRDFVLDRAELKASTAENLHRLLQPGAQVSGRPAWTRLLPELSLAANGSWSGAGEGVAAYHLTNFALHLLNCLLVYVAALALMKNVWPALLAAILFGVHPAGTEAVTNIAARAELLGTFFVLAGFVCYLAGKVARGGLRWAWMLGLLVAQIAAFLSCDFFAWTLWPLLAAAEFSFRKPGEAARKIDRAVWLLLPVLAVAAALEFIHPASVGSPGELGPANPLRVAGWLSARLTAVALIGKQIALLVWPAGLSPDYSFDQIHVESATFGLGEHWRVFATFLLIALMLWVARRRGDRPLFFWTLFVLITLLPASNFFVLGPTIMSERNLYLPLAGFAAWLVSAIYLLCRELVPRIAGGDDWWRRTWPARAARLTLAALAFSYALATFVHNGVWKDDESLWLSAVDAAPGSYRTHEQLANALAAEGTEHAIDRRLHELERARAIAEKPGWPAAHLPRSILLELGAAYRIKGDNLAAKAQPDSAQTAAFYHKSEAALQALLAIPAEGAPAVSWPVYLQIGITNVRLNQPAEALEAFRKVTELAPGNADAYLGLATAFLQSGKPSDAAVALLQTVVLDDRRRETLPLLISTYATLDPGGCAIQHTDGTDKLDATCTIVRSHLSSAYYGLVQNFVAAHQLDTAARIKDAAVRTYGFAPEPFDALLVPAH